MNVNPSLSVVPAENRAIIAEQLARLRRINRDRIIVAALDLLMLESIDRSVACDYHAYIVGAANLQTSHLPDYANVRAYVDALLSEIRAELSPLALNDQPAPYAGKAS